LIEVPPEVVLKEFILPENDRASRKVKDSLLREAALLRRINHPLITRFYDCFIEDLRGYLVIEYSPGLTLKDLVLKNGLPSESLVKNISIQLCDALGYLHSLTPPIIHGDVAPDNVILQPDGTIKLLDFAAARELGRNRTSTVIGKHSYMSPEQFKGMPDSRSDLYSLGGTIYFLLTGTEPEPLTELHPRNLTPSVSVSMDKIVFSATQFDATNRTPDVGTMKSLLEEV
jgi:serine/threonine protein kinase